MTSVGDDFSGDILEFTGANRFLSNFYPCVFEYKGYFWPTSEHAFQAMKVFKGTGPRFRYDLDSIWRFVFPNIKKPVLVTEDLFMYEFTRIPGPSKAKKAGRIVQKREDWDTIRVNVMQEVVNAKFMPNTRMAVLLLRTGDALLEEGNWHGDDFWGVCFRKGTGQNHLGKCLMHRRAELHSLQSKPNGGQL